MEDKIELTIDEKIDTFKNLTISHPKLVEAGKMLERAIREPGGSRIIYLMGPSGVGKTTLFKRINTRLAQQYKDAADPGQIPVIAVEAPAESNGQFNWKHFYVECLKELKDPITLRNYARLDLFGNPVQSKERRSEFELRFAFETALKYRKTKIVLIDEAHHIAIVPSGRRMKDQTEFIKSTANFTDVTYVLFGTYDLMQLCNLNGQLANRNRVVHFPRYDARIENDRRMFKNILLTFQNRIPTPEIPDLENLWEVIYERTIGCVGTCKLWLNRVVVEALRECASTVTQEHLEKDAHSLEQCVQQARDALHGEMHFVETTGQREDLRNLLGLSDELEDKGRLFKTEDINIEKQTQGRQKSQKPGQQSPRRDKVG